MIIGIMAETPAEISAVRDKKERHNLQTQRALEAMTAWLESLKDE